MRYEFSKTQLMRYQRIAYIVSIFCFLVGLILILVVFYSLNELSGYLFKVGMIVVYAAFILFLFDKLHIKPFRNTRNYFFEVNDNEFVLSHPANKDNCLPQQFHFSVDDIKSLKVREVEGFQEMFLEISKPKLNLNIKIWGFENMRQLFYDIQKLMNIRDRK